MSELPFNAVLVANRGEIAVRVLTAAREAGLRGVAVYSDADAKALHVEIADEAIHLPGKTLAETYLNSDAIIAAAQSSGTQAIHPGYGFLSERADFASAVKQSGLVWIGPPPEAISTMGDKISARLKMMESGVPVIPGEELSVPDGANHLGQLAACAARVGYPLLLKASAGGGGKGMRAVSEPKMLRTEYEAASREASAAFGDGTIYVERLLVGARHIEVQVLADSHGNCIHLNERDCSLQRRHQKVIEEAPSPVVNAELRDAMGAAAVRAAKAVEYEGAGTVEFLLSDRGDFFFLEMNTRLQVEHPVTEIITGVDIVREQLRIANGEQLSLTQEQIIFRGHAIECRINAEDPKTFIPSPGTLSLWHPPGGPGIRVESHCYSGYTVPPHYDSMIGKIIAHGADRHMAIARMRNALAEIVAEGIKTNIPLHQEIFQHAAFRTGGTDIHYLENRLGL